MCNTYRILIIKEMYVEISFSSKIQQAVQYFALAGINLDAYVINRDTDEYRFVIRRDRLHDALAFFQSHGIKYTLTPVRLVPERARPGELARYFTRDIRGSYIAEGNRLVLRR